VSFSLQAQVVSLQEQLTQLTEDMRHPRYHGLGAVSFAKSQRAILPVEQQARTEVMPRVEYSPAGSYVILQEEGELSITPDSSDWFDWLASLPSFRFFGKEGHFTAYRHSRRGEFTRGWYAALYMEKQRYKRYIGVTDRLTIAWLEEVAATLQSHKCGGS
jgi:hypothetical protein